MNSMIYPGGSAASSFFFFSRGKLLSGCQPETISSYGLYTKALRVEFAFKPLPPT